MATLNNLINTLVDKGQLRTFYRVQVIEFKWMDLSYKKFSFDGNKIIYDTPERYTYLSDAKKHHDYYLRKRTNQLILKNSGNNYKNDLLSTDSLFIDIKFQKL